MDFKHEFPSHINFVDKINVEFRRYFVAHTLTYILTHTETNTLAGVRVMYQK